MNRWMAWCWLAAFSAEAQIPRTPRVHDPSTLVREQGEVWCFSTGPGTLVLKQDGNDWRFEGSVFPRGSRPGWHTDLVPGNRGDLWAPDVIRLGDRWCVYYSVSTFGKKTSAIGMASRETLGAGSAKDAWVDRGVVISSGDSDRFNAIDPAVIKDGRKLWMAFGSFWDGIMLIELDEHTGLRKEPAEKPIPLAMAREIEAPFLHKEGDWYYLFVNWGKCCRGVDSTYEIRVGRSRSITGPFEDKDGVAMTAGGGSLVLGSDGRHIGPGHASILEQGGKQWLAHHFYDGEDAGKSKLRLSPMKWVDGWPVVGE